MYIDKILIDKAEPDFSLADTMRKREDVINDLKSYMYRVNFDKPFIARQYPVFILKIESRASDIIREGILEKDLESELMHDLNDEILAEESLNKLYDWLYKNVTEYADC